MSKNRDQNFVDPSKFSVIIPYSDLEKILQMAHDMEQYKAENKRLQEQYTAMQGMFSEVLEVVRDIRAYVKDT